MAILKAADRGWRVALTLIAILALCGTSPLKADAAAAAAQPRAPNPTTTRRDCSRAAPGPYDIRSPPSCATRIAERERRYGTRARFVSLRESRQIPASWMWESPWGPCAEGDTLVFLTPAGAELFDRTAGQCDEVFGANPAPAPGGDRPGPGVPPPPRRSAAPGGPGPAPGGVEAGPGVRPPRGNPDAPGPVSGTMAEFPCIDAPPGTVEYVRGLPGGRQCVLRDGDVLWCRQRNAMSRNPYLPTNPAWDLKPVGVRILRDCRIVAIGDETTASPTPSRSAPPPAAASQCCRAADGRAWCPGTDARLLTGHVRLDALRRLSACREVDGRPLDPVVRPVALPQPAGDATRWAKGFTDGAGKCLAVTAQFALDVAADLQRWDFAGVEQHLGLATPADRPAGERGAAPVLSHRLLELTVQAMVADVMRRRLGALADDPANHPVIDDYTSGQLAGEHLCGYGAAATGHKVGGVVARLGGNAIRRSVVAVSRRVSGAAAAQARSAAALIEQLKRRAAARGTPRRPAALTQAETQQAAAALGSVERVDPALLESTPLQGAVQFNAVTAETVAGRGLANTRITVPGAAGPVELHLGDFLGKGAFSATYEVLDATGNPSAEVLKIVYQTSPYERGLLMPAEWQRIGGAVMQNAGGDSVGRQVRGANLLRRAGLPTPEIVDYHAGTQPGELSYIRQRRIDLTQPGWDDWNGTKLSAAAKEQAANALLDRIGDAGIIAPDSSPRNLYFFAEPGSGRVRAGIWDTDFIYDARSRLDPVGDAMARGSILGEITKQAEQSAAGATRAARNAGLFYDIDWQDPRAAMRTIRDILYGP